VTGRARLVRWMPVAVSVVSLVGLALLVDLRELLRAFDSRALLRMAPTLAGYGVASLALEAWSLVRLAPRGGAHLDAWGAARMKAASYLVQLVHYSLGMAALAYLLGKRTRTSAGRATGTVLLLAGVDVAVLALLTVASVRGLGSDAGALRLGLLVLLLTGFAAGLLVLRANVPLGPLGRLRNLPPFEVARSVPIVALAEVAFLRLLFAGSFVVMVGLVIHGFGIRATPAELTVRVAFLLLVSALPIAVAGIGTGQAAFVYVFRGRADPATLMACSLALSIGLLALRGLMGLLFAGEYGKAAFSAVKRGELEPPGAADSAS